MFRFRTEWGGVADGEPHLGNSADLDAAAGFAALDLLDRRATRLAAIPQADTPVRRGRKSEGPLAIPSRLPRGSTASSGKTNIELGVVSAK